MTGGPGAIAQPAWAHAAGVLAMGLPEAPRERSHELERALIAERASRYCWAYDERRSELIESCFSEDAVWEGVVAGGRRVGPLRTRAAIVSWLTGFWAHQHHQPRHVLLNTVIEQQTETRARTLSYLLLTTASRGRAAISTTGFYRLSLTRAAGGWQISHMFAGFDAPFWPGKLEQLSERGRQRHGLFDTPR
jgi:hypothetical protein